MKHMTSSLALAAALSVSSAGGALAENVITLQSQDKAVNLTGELVSFENDIYIIRTKLGALRISADRVDCFGEACPTAQEEEVVARAAFTPGLVTLRSVTGDTSINGELLSFENDIYVLRTGFGTLQISASESVCEGEFCPVTRADLKDVNIAASQDLAQVLVKDLIAGFAASEDAAFSDSGNDALVLTAPDGEEYANVTLASASGTDAIRSLIAGEFDLAATSRALDDSVREQLLAESSEKVLALDAVAIAVAPSNTLTSIGQDDIARIFSGDVTDWAELGGTPGPINLYVRADDSGTATLFSDLVMAPARADIARSATVLEADEDLSAALSSDPMGIGYTSFGALANAKPLAIRGSCGIQTPVNEFTIKTEEYPLTQRVSMFRPQADIPQPATDFVNFVSSDVAQNIVKASGYVAQDVTSMPLNEQGLRFVSAMLPSDADTSFEQMQSMMLELSRAERLSLTFRFDEGSANLDARAQDDVQRLANLMTSGALDNKELIVAGFTDSIGVGEINEGLSLARAEQVRSAVLAQAGISDDASAPLRAVGYGELSPLGCNDSLSGRKVNRRVEIWMQDKVVQ